MKNLLRQLTVAGIALLATSVVFAQGHEGGCACGRIPAATTPFQIEHSDSSFAQAAAAELDRWNRYVNVFTTTPADGTFGGNNGKNEIVFATPQQVRSSYGFDINSEVFGVTPMFPESAFGSPAFNACPVPAGTTCGTITEADVLMNSEFVNGWTVTRPADFDDSSGPALYGATAGHELGHALGFHHNFSNMSTMNYYQDYAAQYLTLSDAAAARAHYPNRVQTVTDMAVYPFYFDVNASNGYDAARAGTFAPQAVAPGAVINVKNFSVENLGTTDLSGVQLRFYLSTDANITASDILLGGFTFASFPRNNFSDDEGVGSAFTVPASTPNGSYFVGAIITHSNGSSDNVTYNNTTVMSGKLAVGNVTGSTCTASNQQLNLNSNRFRMNASWKDFSGNTGCGTAVPLTADTGYFWFFNAANVELVVKALDGRGVNGKFWIFYGALSNVEYTLTVTDTVTGAVKTYKNPLGAFGSVGDTNAF